ncbi:hypothetical protein DL98DRAFT_595484 [Cadophora sp. DSE1049]|nr:hypothetical protein DL98DRAFT_595484 [Cadophora sp. DSE1049]
MPLNNTYSTTAVDGSADEFSPSPTSHTPKTPSQIAAEEALALTRIQTFISNYTTSTVSISLVSNSTVASRLAAAQASITAFDAAFKGKDDTSK